MNSLAVRSEASSEVSQHRATPRFTSTREAKEFLIDWIVAEARRLQEPLTEVERKMLYASKNGWTLPDMDVVQDAFDRYHEAVEYELKMTNLIRLARADVASGGPEEWAGWNEAIQTLGREDHYLLQMIAASEGPIRRHVSRWKLWLAALVILGVSIAIVFSINNR